MGTREDGKWQAGEVGVDEPRQNGKGEILMAREGFGLFELGEMFQAHTAHEFKTSERHFQRFEGWVRSQPDLLAQVKRAPSGRIVGFRYSHGDEAIELESGARIEFRTRTKGGMRGFDDVSLLVLDEAMILSEWAHGAMLPTIRASKAERGPQLWYAGSAADQEVHEHSIVWTRVRERGIAGDDPGLAYFEWSLDYDHPDAVPDEVASDPESWIMVNPAITRGRVALDIMERELRALGRRQFVVELLGVGDWPDTSELANQIIDHEAWLDTEDRHSVLSDPICLYFDVSPDRRTSIAAGGLNEQGVLHGEVIDSRAGTGWVPGRMAELCERHEVIEVGCDGFGPANSIAAKIEEEAGLKVRRLNAGEYADACGFFVGEVNERRFRHLGQEELNGAARGARPRPLVDRWAVSRSKSKVDPGPLIATILASWAAAEQDFGTIEIFF